jgi:hypothetical protein
MRFLAIASTGTDARTSSAKRLAHIEGARDVLRDILDSGRPGAPGSWLTVAVLPNPLTPR